jgi:hypothetical protein
MAKNLVGRGRDLILRHYSRVRLKGLTKTTKNLNQDSRLPGQRFEPGTSRIRNRSVSHSTMTFGVGPRRSEYITLYLEI